MIHVIVFRVEKSKYETASSVDPDFARFKLIHPDSNTPSPVWIIAKNYSSMKDKCFPYMHVAKLIAAPPNYDNLLCELCVKIVHDN